MRVGLSPNLIYDFALSRQGFVHRRVAGKDATDAEPFSKKRMGPFYHFGVDRRNTTGTGMWKEACGYRRWVDIFSKPVLACWLRYDTNNIRDIIAWLQEKNSGSFFVSQHEFGSHRMRQTNLYEPALSIQFFRTSDAMRFRLAFDVDNVEEYTTHGRKQPRA